MRRAASLASVSRGFICASSLFATSQNHPPALRHPQSLKTNCRNRAFRKGWRPLLALCHNRSQAQVQVALHTVGGGLLGTLLWDHRHSAQVWWSYFQLSTQSFICRSAPRPPIPSTSSGNPRRPLSSSDEEATDRPKKKKKRKIIDPEKGAAFANTKVSLSGTPSASATRPSPIQLKLPSTARSRGLNSLRRVTLDIGSLDQTVERNLLRAGNQNINKQISETFLPLSSAPIGPLLKKYKPQVESTSSSEQGSSSSSKR